MAKNQVTLTFAGDEKDLLRSMDRVGDGSRKMAKDVDRASNVMSTAETSSGLLTAGIGKLAIGFTAVTASLGFLGKEIFESSRQIQDLDRKSGAVFKDQLPAIEKWAEANRKAFGTSSRQVVAMATNFADLLIPMGFTAKQAATMSQKVLGLAGALSKWSGGTRSVAEVSSILTKAMLGERDELKGLGISISDADVKTRLLAKGQQDLTGVALQQAVALATQELIFEKSADAQTAWAKGGRAAAEAQGTLGSSIDTIKEKLAVLFTPAISAATEAVGKFADGLVNKFDVFAPRVQSFVDKELGGLVAALVNLKDNVLTGVKDGFDDIKSAIDENSESWRNLADAVETITNVAAPAVKWALKEVGAELADDLIWIAKLIDAIDWLIERAKELGHWLGRLTGVGEHPFTGIEKISKFGGTVNPNDRPPKFHSGGVMPGAPGTEGLAILQAGETVSPPGAAPGGPIVLTLRSSGSRVDDLLVEILSRAVDVRGGNVQLAVGR